MDGWGSLTMLIKRQEAAKFRKADLRAELKNRKEGYIHDPYTMKDEFDFPQVSELEMEKIIKAIRKKHKKQRIVQFVFSSILLSVILLVLYLVL